MSDLKVFFLKVGLRWIVANCGYVLSGDAKENRFTEDKDEYGSEVMSEIHIVGRITINLWRIMKTEVTEILISPSHSFTFSYSLTLTYTNSNNNKKPEASLLFLFLFLFFFYPLLLLVLLLLLLSQFRHCF